MRAHPRLGVPGFGRDSRTGNGRDSCGMLEVKRGVGARGSTVHVRNFVPDPDGLRNTASAPGLEGNEGEPQMPSLHASGRTP
jgi:hypothetical protein